MSELRVCFFLAKTYALFSKSGEDIGGAEVNLYYLSKALAEDENLKVQFVVGDYRQEHTQTIDGVEVVKSKFLNDKLYPSLFYKIARRFSFCYQLFKLDFDVIITSTANEFCGYIILIAKLLKRKKVIFRVAHDWDVNGHFTRRKNLTGILYSFALKRFDKIICQNEDQRVLLKTNENLSSIIIKNGFPLHNGELKKFEERICFLWVARSDAFKRPLLFLDLAEHLPTEKFTMIIPDQNNLKSEVEKRAESIPNITIINHVPFTEIGTYFQDAKCFVNTSESEGFPNTFIQSCLNGAPILSFKVDPDNILERYGLGICCNDRMEVAVSFLKNLSKQNFERLSYNGWSYLRNNHDIKEKSLQYKEAIFEVVNKNQS